MKANVKKAGAAYDAGNRIAARIVLSDIARYGGEQAGLVIWARLIEAKAVPTVRGPLFKATGGQAAA
jgi:hypothetical protein